MEDIDCAGASTALADADSVEIVAADDVARPYEAFAADFFVFGSLAVEADFVVDSVAKADFVVDSVEEADFVVESVAEADFLVDAVA
jgi:hypothetical protein